MVINRSIQSVSRALDIMELFSRSENELSVKEISEKLDLAKSTVHGLLKTLVNREYLEQNPENQKYKLSLKIIELGQVLMSSMDIRKLTYPVIQKLSEMFKETLHLVVWNGNRAAVYIEKIEGYNALRMSSQIGRRALLHCTGVGKVILAFLDPSERDNVLSKMKLTAFTSRTITDITTLKKELLKIRELGYSIDNEEIEIGLKCIAAPILNSSSKVIGSISCSGQKQKMDIVENDVVFHVKQAAMEISKKLGYSNIPT